MKPALTCIFCLALALVLSSPMSAFSTEETVQFGRLGKINIYRASPHPSQVVLFVSGDGGWNLGVIDMAKALSSLDSLVAGIDITHYLGKLAASSDKCYYPAGELEQLSMYLQKKYGFTSYSAPVLVGYSSGATLVYAALVQAPPGTFQGAISLGFCPDLPVKKPLCRGNGLESRPGSKGKGYDFLPAKQLATPWLAFQGEIDQVCNAAQVATYVKQVNNGELVLLPKVGHGYSVQRNWMPQFRKAFTDLVDRKKSDPTSTVARLKDLPLVEVPATGEETDSMAVMVSGDGGWAGIDRETAGVLAEHGIPVVGLNSLDYFWQGRSPQEASGDLARILEYYLAAWHKTKVTLIGYSMGAEVLPFMINGLPREIADRVGLVALLAPGSRAVFQFHLSYWLGEQPSHEDSYPVLPEVLKVKGIKVLCLYGESEKDSICRGQQKGLLEGVELKGGHHFAGEYEKIARIILDKSS